MVLILRFNQTCKTNHKVVEMFTDVMESRHEIEVVFPSQVEYMVT